MAYHHHPEYHGQRRGDAEHAPDGTQHDVRPGLTGYAQAYGRNTLTWEDKFNHDVYYVRHITFALDCKIIVHTVLIVLTRQGINSATCETMEEFKGTSA